MGHRDRIGGGDVHGFVAGRAVASRGACYVGNGIADAVNNGLSPARNRIGLHHGGSGIGRHGACFGGHGIVTGSEVGRRVADVVGVGARIGEAIDRVGLGHRGAGSGRDRACTIADICTSCEIVC